MMDRQMKADLDRWLTTDPHDTDEEFDTCIKCDEDDFECLYRVEVNGMTVGYVCHNHLDAAVTHFYDNNGNEYCP